MSTAPRLSPRKQTAAPPNPIKAFRAVGASRVAIGHAVVDSCSSEEACAAILAHAAAGREPAYVITPNAQHIVLLNQDAGLREIYRNAHLVVPDGISLLLAARLFARPLRERVTGVDLFQSLCAGAAAAGLRVFFLGGLPGSADLAAVRLRQRTPTLDITTCCPPMGFERDQREMELVARAIRAARPHLVFVGLGAPKQEYWIYNHGLKLGGVYLGIGGSFEMVSGVVKRAPSWVMAIGCEWLYRLCMEPRRMWRRYLIGNAEFVVTVLKQLLNPARFNPDLLNVLPDAKV